MGGVYNIDFLSTVLWGSIRRGFIRGGYIRGGLFEKNLEYVFAYLTSANIKMLLLLNQQIFDQVHQCDLYSPLYKVI